MIVKEKSNSKKSKGSIQKAVEAIERKEVVISIKDGEPLIGRTGYFHCENCDNETVHRLSTLSSECNVCKTKVNLLKGEQKRQKLEEFILF